MAEASRKPEIDFIRRYGWRLMASRANILIIGSEDAAEAALQQLSSLVSGPLHACRLPGPLRLPQDGSETLLLQSVGALTRQQQSDLLQWLESPEHGSVVSLNSSSVFDLVLAGEFDDQLYYRLNTVLEVAGVSGRSSSP